MTSDPLGRPEYDYPLRDALQVELTRHIARRDGVRPSRYVVPADTYAALKAEGACSVTMDGQTLMVFGINIVPEAPKS